MDFRKWFEVYDTEAPVINRLAKSDLAGQAQIDKNLHKSAIGDGRFGRTGDDFLAKDTQVKDNFQKIIQSVKTGQWPDLSLITATIRGLEFDQGVHARYLGQPENPETGSHGWHKQWLDTYSGWLGYLKGLIRHHPEYHKMEISDGMKLKPRPSL